MTSYQAERFCVEQNGSLPIVHNLQDVKDLWSQLELPNNRLYLGVSQIKDLNEAYIVQWEDGYRPFHGKNLGDLNREECQDKYNASSDTSRVYGVALKGVLL